VSEYHQGTHNCWDRTYRDPGLYDWLFLQSRRRNLVLRAHPFRFLPTEELLANWNVLGTGKWVRGDGDSLVSAGGEENGLGYLCSDSEYSAFDFHVDVRFDRKATCRIGLLTDYASSPPEGCVLTICCSEMGAGGVAINGVGPEMGILSPDAQHAIDPHGWNDLRIRNHQGQMTLEINGWQALELSSPLPPGATCRIALCAAPGKSQTQWRYVRLRDLNQLSDLVHDNASSYGN
jgi:hypothetical protein